MLGPVSISLGTLVIELIIFLLMVYVMETLVFNPIRAKWAERDRLIQEGLQASTGSRDEAAEARAEVQRILQGARQTAQREIDQATAAAGRERDRLLAEATEEFRRIVADAREGLVREREESAAALRGRIVDLALAAAQTVTGQSYDQPRVRQLAAAVVQREGLE